MRPALAALLFCFAWNAPCQHQTSALASIPVAPVPDTASVVHSGDITRAAHFRVRVLDGRNGLPIRNAHVRLWYDEPAGAGYELATDLHGEVNMPAPAGEPVRVLVSVVDYTDCRRPLRGDPPQGYSLVALTKSGLVTENSCGQVAIPSQPGEIVLFARPLRWYEGLNRASGN